MSYLCLEDFDIKQTEKKQFRVVIRVVNDFSSERKTILDIEQSFPFYIAFFILPLVVLPLVGILIIFSIIWLTGISLLNFIENSLKNILFFNSEKVTTWQIQFNNLIKTISSYLDLPNDWDGYDGVVPTSQTIQDCIFLIKRLPKSIDIPKPMLGGSGTVGLYWEKDGLYAEICFEGDGTFWYYGTDNDNEIGVDSIELLQDTQFPIELHNLLKKI
ncbi:MULTISPECIES: hypothetical protein [Spirulina sp. CCY15215]|uniref:hypothetical protein n=1 Tax=Spirulina sp. CCY15215 TaxID=2767591 RepID=UPI00194EC19F|nr:hypothetical protein [Spirulina major]